ncbi:hypothetical protein GCM10009691_34990 [Brevibacterium picturae]|uniref:Uncharacterized protein n=2 Tax=Brevibacterium picturae TaxID=260553 RepID=A0ABP4N8N4_9MICO
MGKFIPQRQISPSITHNHAKYKTKTKVVMALASTTICLSGMGISAPASASESSTGMTQSATATTSLSASDWRVIAKRAGSAGDKSGAEAAQHMAIRTANSPQSSKLPTKPAQPQNIVTTVVKKAVIAALRHGGNKLPKKIRPYSQKILNFLEDLEKWQEGPIITGLMAAGLPYDIASYTATWIVTFAGV